MILKIQKPNPDIIAAVRYNENKMSGREGIRPSNDNTEELSVIEDGHILATRNVPEDTTLADEFERLKLLSIKKRRNGPPIQNVAFHMSVNPSDSDRKLDEAETVQLIDDVMESLGYGQQPYRIYKHTDIPRQHYHVVSCRAGQDGKKIEDSFERLKLRRFLKSISEKYGFEIILNSYEKQQEAKKEKKKTLQETEALPLAVPVPSKEPAERKKKAVKEKSTKKVTFVPSFGRDKETPVTTQINNIMEDVLAWHFSTFEQLQLLLLKRYSLRLENEGAMYGDHLVYSGVKLNKDQSAFKIVTPFLKEKDLGNDYMSRIKSKLENEKMSSRKEQKTRIEKLSRAAAAAAGSYDEFLSIMEQKGVWVMLSWKKDDSGPFGVTYIDRATKCIWKGSEISANLGWLQDIATQKGWTLEKTPIVEASNKRNSMPSRKAALSTRKEPISPATPAGQAGSTLPRFRAGHQQGSTADAKNNRDSVLDEKNNKPEKPKEYIGEQSHG